MTRIGEDCQWMDGQLHLTVLTQVQRDKAMFKLARLENGHQKETAMFIPRPTVAWCGEDGVDGGVRDERNYRRGL